MHKLIKYLAGSVSVVSLLVMFGAIGGIEADALGSIKGCVVFIMALVVFFASAVVADAGLEEGGF